MLHSRSILLLFLGASVGQEASNSTEPAPPIPPAIAPAASNQSTPALLPANDGAPPSDPNLDDSEEQEANSHPLWEEAAAREHYERRYKWDVVLVANLGAKAKQTVGNYTGSISKLKHIKLNVEFHRLHPSLSIVTVDNFTKEPAIIVPPELKGGNNGSSGGAGGMALSDLQWYRGELISCDASTGIIYILPIGSGKIKAHRWLRLGHKDKPFPCKWMTIMEGLLVVGANGVLSPNKTSGRVQHVKMIPPSSEIVDIDWNRKYDKVAAYLNAWPPGVVEHEAVRWSEIMRKWVFLPRHIQREGQAGNLSKGANSMIVTDRHFRRLHPVNINAKSSNNSGASFTSFAWVPGTGDQVVVALKVDDAGGTTYATAFDMSGRVVMPETKIADEAYEGIAFVKSRRVIRRPAK